MVWISVKTVIEVYIIEKGEAVTLIPRSKFKSHA